MYKTKKYGVVSCKTEHKILAELERNFEKKRKKKHESARHNHDKKSKSKRLKKSISKVVVRWCES